MHHSALRSFLIVSSLGLLACGEPSPATDAGTPGGDAAPMEDGSTADAGPPPECTGRPADAPVTRSEVGMVYDGARNRLVIYGGNTAASEMCSVPPSRVVDEMWAFHFDCGNWEQLTPSGGPGALRRHATVYDASRDRMLTFGGRGASYSNAVWAFDLATDTWSEVTTSGTAPPPLAEAIAQVDATRDRLLVFGGALGADGFGFDGTDGLFALDLATNTWSEITAGGEPGPRLYHASAIVGDELVIHGGTNSFGGPYFNDTYAFNMATDTWRAISGGTAPRERFGAELIADAERNRVIMAFGHDATNLGNSNDVWALDLGAGTWTELHTGDTPNAPAAGMCDFPADFTVIEDNAPERRYSIGVAHAGDHAYVFGGKADCGYLNDVWSIDLATGAWTLVRASTGGEVCLRTGRTDCTSLCF